MIKQILNLITQTVGKSAKNNRRLFNWPVTTLENSLVPRDAQNTQLLHIKTYRIIWNTFSFDKYCSMSSVETTRIGFELLNNDVTTDTSEN